MISQKAFFWHPTWTLGDKHILISGCDPEQPTEAGGGAAEERGRGSDGNFGRAAAAAAAEEAELAVLLPGSCRGRLCHGSTKPRWGQQQTQNQPGGKNR